MNLAFGGLNLYENSPNLATRQLCVAFTYFKGPAKVATELSQQLPLKMFKTPSPQSQRMRNGALVELPNTYLKALKRHSPKHTGSQPSWLVFTASTFD